MGQSLTILHSHPIYKPWTCWPLQFVSRFLIPAPASFKMENIPHPSNNLIGRGITLETVLPLRVVFVVFHFALSRITAKKRQNAPLLYGEVGKKVRVQKWTADAESLLQLCNAKFEASEPMLRATIKEGSETTILNPTYLKEFFIRSYSDISNLSNIGRHGIHSNLTQICFV
ncbi:hypothetical protein MPH_00181 [Macrophomina phaseolina MS6]|uniref:Uncharacterized protein n=1 Tax=Macrophomina phaseolina (strain MS6) TaxID=1126212 RepID=K2RIQ6_MACPH|nr:hypothetical protein MPH_00181 [Macrophomina phaseolina MS6]